MEAVSNGKAVTVKKIFSRETAVSILIKADKDRVWTLLTNPVNYPEWNTTVSSIRGRMEEGGTIRLVSTLDPERAFKLKVTQAVPGSLMVWKGFLGSRTFRLKSIEAGITEFSMHEKIGGLFFPLFAKKIPSFDEAFEHFARDLKREAEFLMKNNRKE